VVIRDRKKEKRRSAVFVVFVLGKIESILFLFYGEKRRARSERKRKRVLLLLVLSSLLSSREREGESERERLFLSLSLSLSVVCAFRISGEDARPFFRLDFISLARPESSSDFYAS